VPCGDSGGDPQLIGDLLEHIEQAENGTERGSFGKHRLIEIAAQGGPEGLDTRRRPLGEIGEGAIFDFTPSRKASRRRMAGMYIPTGIGDLTGPLDLCPPRKTRLPAVFGTGAFRRSGAPRSQKPDEPVAGRLR